MIADLVPGQLDNAIALGLSVLAAVYLILVVVFPERF